MAFGWQGDKVRLVPLDHARHFENFVQWLNDPEITAWTIQGDFPLSRLAEEEIFRKLAANSPDHVVFAIETLEGEHIGSTGLHHIEPRNGVAMSGLLLGRKDLWGRGYGSDAAKVRARYAFEVLNLRMIMCEVMAPNAGSIRALQKIGYREYGRLPQRSWKRGAYRDIVLMYLAREFAKL